MSKHLWYARRYRLMILVGYYLLGFVLLGLYITCAFFCPDNYLITIPIRGLVFAFGVGKLTGGLLLVLWPEMIEASPKTMARLWQQHLWIPFVLCYEGLVIRFAHLVRLVTKWQEEAFAHAPPFQTFTSHKTPYKHYPLSCCLLE